MNISRIDEKNNYVYFIASPENATQAYLYRARLDGKGKAELISPANQPERIIMIFLHRPNMQSIAFPITILRRRMNGYHFQIIAL